MKMANANINFTDMYSLKEKSINTDHAWSHSQNAGSLFFILSYNLIRTGSSFSGEDGEEIPTVAYFR